MRVITTIVAVMALASACEKANPNVCCATEAQCAAIGVDELRPCGPGQACKDTTCVASECDTSMDCPVENPICVANVCVGSCSNNDECDGTGRPFCEAGVCVGCRSPVDCSASQPICDQEDRACRGCELDIECTSGVCIEADNVCATTDQIIYVEQSGMDTGTCSVAAPCGSLGYAVQQLTPTRNVIRVIGGDLSTGETVSIGASVIFDGNATIRARFEISGGTVTIEGVTLAGNPSMPDEPTINVSAGVLRVRNTTTNAALINATNATVDLPGMRVISSTGNATMVKCSTGTLSVVGVEFQRAMLESINCFLTIQRSRFDNTGPSIQALGGKVLIENNLIVEAYELSDSMYAYGSASGSAIRFNTFVNTSGVDSSGVALDCDNSQDVSNNIFAYRSSHPLNGPPATPCRARYSLFDSAAVPEQRSGDGNRAAEFALIFANAGARDFHLAPTSQAKEGAEPNVLDIDLDGAPRPRPAGTNPDMGCFEGP